MSEKETSGLSDCVPLNLQKKITVCTDRNTQNRFGAVKRSCTRPVRTRTR